MTPFQHARTEEHQNRTLAYLPLAPSLCGCPVVPFTARHRLELEAIGNPILCGGDVTVPDVLAFLWRLNHCFRRPTGETPNVQPGIRPPSLVASWLMRHRLRSIVLSRRFYVLAAVHEIRSRIALAYQDQAAILSNGAEPSRSELAPDRYWLDGFVAFYCGQFGWTCDVVLDTPLAILFQIYREHWLARGVDMPFIAPSDALYGRDE